MWPSHGTAQATNFDELKHCCIKTLFPPLFSPGRPCLPGSQEEPRSTIRNLVSGVECWLHKTNSGNIPSLNFQKLHVCFKLAVLQTGQCSPGTVGFLSLSFQKCPPPPAVHLGLQCCSASRAVWIAGAPHCGRGLSWSRVHCPMATGVLAGTPQLRPLTGGQSLSAAEVHMLSLPAALSRRTGNLLTLCTPSHTLGSIGCKVTPEIPWASRGICTSW